MLRKFRLKKIIENSMPTPCGADGQIARADFDAALHSGTIFGQHLPCDLPDTLQDREADDAPLSRYQLVYIWDENLPRLGVISCNPSHATRRETDETVYNTATQARIWGFGGIDQCNLSPVYEPNSKIAHDSMNLIDERNWDAIARVLLNEHIWLSWGTGLVKGPSAGGTPRLWRQAEERLLEMIYSRQQGGGCTLFVTDILERSRYCPPHHPRRLYGERHLFERPIEVEISLHQRRRRVVIA